MRTDYDKIAHLYDNQPFRDKDVDPNLENFINEHPGIDLSDISILDLGCGTGNQLVANYEKYPDIRMVGLDLFSKMLEKAREKSDRIKWIQGDSANPDLSNEEFDFITNQFSYHHVKDKKSFVKSIYRLLKPGGRFVLTNICPHKMSSWAIYGYFPAALETDLNDFSSPDELIELFEAAGFERVRIEFEDALFKQTISEFLDYVKNRDVISQLMAISDRDYEKGIERIEKDQNQYDSEKILNNHIVLLTLIAEKGSRA